MALSFRGRDKRLRRFFARGRIGRYLPRFFFPFFNLGRIRDDLNLSLVIAEAHPTTESLLVKAPQTPLVIVMIGRTKQCPAQPVARDVGEISLGGLRLGN